MQTNGQRGVLFPSKTGLLAGSPTYISLDQAKEMYSRGWDISHHAGARIDTMTPEDREEAVNGEYYWLLSQGFYRSAKFYAYPSGAYGSADYLSSSKVQENHVFARTTIASPSDVYNSYSAGQIAPEFNENDPYSDERMFLQVSYVFSSTAVADVKTKIDQFIDNKTLVILLFHNITTPTFGFETTPTNFEEISDYLKTKEDAGDLEVITFSDLYKSYLYATQASGVSLNGVSFN
jgi:uncharacterized protein YozE (UPF0346 family)